jgi:hypothetical protein
VKTESSLTIFKVIMSVMSRKCIIRTLNELAHSSLWWGVFCPIILSYTQRTDDLRKI